MPTVLLYLQVKGFCGLNLYLFLFYVYTLENEKKNQDKKKS